MITQNNSSRDHTYHNLIDFVNGSLSHKTYGAKQFFCVILPFALVTEPLQRVKKI